MRPELLRIPYHLPTALIVWAVAVVAGVLVARRAGGAWGEALGRSLAASVSCGLFGGRAPGAKTGPDLFLPGALGSLAGVLPALVVLKNGQGFEVPVAGYPTSLALGILACILIAIPRTKKFGIDRAHLLDLAIIIILSGPIGSRAFFVAQFWNDHFADRPARLAIGKVAGLAPGDELVLRTGEGEVRVAFDGTEKTFEDVQRKLDVGRAGVAVRVARLQRRGEGTQVLARVRGLALETVARGPSATLAAAGSAAGKLGLLPGVVARGVAVPAGEVFKVWNGGIVFYGGLLLATAACILYIRVRGYRVLAIADMVAPTLGIGLAFGRLGCTLNGCCWGKPVEGALAVRFPVGSHPWRQHARTVAGPELDAAIDGSWSEGLRAALPAELWDGSFPIHFVQFYGIIADLLLAAAVFAFDRYFARREGQTFFFFYLAYACVRFTLEHFRGDHGEFVYLLGYPLTMSQRVALITAPLGIAGLAWVARYGIRRGAAPDGGPTQLVGAMLDGKNPGPNG